MSLIPERLGEFYLGRLFDLKKGETLPEPLLYEAKDLTTHAVCVGMTGSGKTGLCVSLLEEAAIDGIPSIVIDPKGDLGNLLLAFPNLAPEDFRPWVEASDAARAGQTPDEYAAATAEKWRTGLANWDQDAARIQRFKDAVDIAIYTPGSSAGLPLTVLRSFKAPPKEMLRDVDALRERISSAASGLLALMGFDADPIRSREHILISNLLQDAWQNGRDLDIAGLIREIQQPPFEKVGFLDLESFFPARDRAALAMSLNNLLASPGFAGWLDGEPLDVQRLLYTREGKPRVSIISIAHLSDAERMFLVTILLNEVLAWVRTQSGTSSLRALLYMDEVFGYFPPTANPPSKKPMLTLLKQARAFGVGVVLATQNPVDLDYKGLANTGTWLIGRLQTERDKMRVLEGLEGASAAAGSNFNRSEMEATLAGLGQRVFLMNNVHEDHPVVFQSRWALSYLRGPLTRTQIQTLMDERRQTSPPRTKAQAVATSAPNKSEPMESINEDDTEALNKPPQPAHPNVLIPPTVEQRYLRITKTRGASARVVYRPALLGMGRLHFVKATYAVDLWKEFTLLAAIDGDVPTDPWAECDVLEKSPDWERAPVAGAQFEDSPVALAREANFKSWTSALKNHLYRTEELAIFKCATLKEFSQPGEEEGAFRARLRQKAIEIRDLEKEKLRKKYAAKWDTLDSRRRTAQQRVEREKAQANQSTMQSMISLGTTVIGALMGRKIASRTNISKAGTAVRSVGKAASDRGDIARAEESVEAIDKQIADLDVEVKAELEKLQEQYDAEKLEFEKLTVPPRKSDIAVSGVTLAWTPWLVSTSGIAEPAWG